MVRWYGTQHLKFVAREITSASVLELIADAADSIEETIPGAKVEAISKQDNGEKLLISFSVNSTQLTIGVTNGTA